jgi:hypothetical protein
LSIEVNSARLEGAPLFCLLRLRTRKKKQGATGITTVAPYVAGQWGRGEDRLPE